MTPAYIINFDCQGGLGSYLIYVIIYIMWYIKIHVFDGVDYENDIKNFHFWVLRGVGWYFICFYTHIKWYSKIYVFDGADYENDIKNFQFWFLRGGGWYFICLYIYHVIYQNICFWWCRLWKWHQKYSILIFKGGWGGFLLLFNV